MFGSVKQSAQKPTVLGTLLQSSAYGVAIPQIWGMTKTTFLAIWAANIRQGSSNKKLKNFFAAKKGTITYCENIDFLLGHAPMMCMNQIWSNGGLYPLEIASQSFIGDSFNLLTADPNFYSVIAALYQSNYNITFNDFGGPGSVNYSGTWYTPLWNTMETGPDPTNPMSFRVYPYTFSWKPAFGGTVYTNDLFNQLPFNNIVVFYYKKTAATSFQSPLQRLRLTFESELGTGPEYSGFSSQQVEYPMYSGVGSPNIDLGITGSLPSLQGEVKAKWGVYESGDTDFVNIIEDIIRSGIAQAAIDGSQSFTQLEHGLSSYNFPGVIQKQLDASIEAFAAHPQTYYLNTTAGNFLVVLAAFRGVFGTVLTISDSLGLTWTPLLPMGTGSVWGAWVAKSTGGPCTVTVSNLGDAWDQVMFEVAGVDSIDSITPGLPGIGTSCTATNDPGNPSYVLAINLYINAGKTVPTTKIPVPGGWDWVLWNQAQFDVQYQYWAVLENRSLYPGEFFLPPLNNGSGGQPDYTVMLAFKATTPPTYPKPVDDFIDDDSLELTRTQCRAYGLFGSLNANSQQAARDWLKQLCQAANCAPFFEGFQLHFVPYAEQSTVGNGAVYTSPTSTGPVAFLSDVNGDFIPSSKSECVTLTTIDRTDKPNILQLQFYNRTSNYNQVTISQPFSASITLAGARKATPEVNNAIQDVTVGRSILNVMVQKAQLGGDLYSFSITTKWDWLGLMDLIQITDTQAGLFNVNVRLTKMSEGANQTWDCEAEPFVYGMMSPTPLSTSVPTPTGSNDPNASAGNVNTPIIFEAVPRMLANTAQPELWLVISSNSDIYGGCQVLISTDGGASYNNIGNTVFGSATTGAVAADWPLANDPDTTNDLLLNGIVGELDSYTTTEENNFAFPCYVGNPSPPAGIPYEIMSYAVANLTGVGTYTLKATGSGNFLRRGVFGAPGLGVGMDHPIGSVFGFLDPSGTGLLKLSMPQQWIGITLKFKILSFNTQGGGLQDPSTVTVYSFTPTGLALTQPPYTNNPNFALTQPTATTIHLADTVVTFPANTANYNARTFTIPTPTSGGVWYYVTIADNPRFGDTGSALTCTAYCESNTSKVGVAGYTFMGGILALPGGSGTVFFPGGWPAQQLFQVNGS